MFILTLEPTQPPIQWVLGALSQGMKQLGWEADHSSPQGQTKGQASRAAAEVTNLEGVLRCHWNNQKYEAGNLKFAHAK
jgi:hypothetical protein